MAYPRSRGIASVSAIAGIVHDFAAITGDVHKAPLLRKTMMMLAMLMDDSHDFIAPFVEYVE